MKGAQPWAVYRPVLKSGRWKKKTKNKYPPRTRSIIFKRRRKTHKKWRHIQQLPIKDQQQHFVARCEHKSAATKQTDTANTRYLHVTCEKQHIQPRTSNS
jgi:hypothetical protein